MQVKYDLVVDFARPTKSNTIIIAEGDANSRVAHFVLLANKLPMQMTDVTVATVKAIKDDGSVIFGDARIIEDEYGNKLNEVEYIIPASMTDYAGNVTMTISLMSSMNELITSWEFYLKVRNALYNEDDYVSESDLSGFRDLLNRSEAAVKKIEEMTAQNALPNPYPLNINMEGEDIAYSGRETVDIELVNMAYIGEAKGYEEPIDESAAGAAAESARQAKVSEYNTNLSKTAAEFSASVAQEGASKAIASMNSAEGYAGMCEAYRNQCRDLANGINPSSYTTDGLSYRACTYVSGGYFKVGSIVFLNIRIKATANGVINVEGLPKYTEKAAKHIVTCNTFNMTDDSKESLYSYVNMGGVAVVNDAIANKEYAISAVYLCNGGA